jgi:hypothetical protein
MVAYVGLVSFVTVKLRPRLRLLRPLASARLLVTNKRRLLCYLAYYTRHMPLRMAMAGSERTAQP